MNTTPSKPKQTSRWGSLLQGAVAGIESRLDTILAEDAAPTRNAKGTESVKNSSASRRDVTIARNGRNQLNDISRTPPTSQTAERPLQKYSKSLPESETPQRPSSAASDRSVTRTDAASSTSKSLGSAVETAVVEPEDDESQKDQHREGSKADSGATFGTPEIEALAVEPLYSDSAPEHQQVGSSVMSPAWEERDSPATSRNLDVTEDANSLGSLDRILPPNSENVENASKNITPLPIRGQAAEKTQSEQNEGTHALLERIDALQAKLLYLANEAVDSARKAAMEAPRGSVERLLADKDAQIAMLLQEGEKLSRSEVQQTATIKKLRVRVVEDQKSLTEMKRFLKRSENSLSASNEELSRIKVSQRSVNEKLSRLSRLEKESDTLRAERDTKDSTIVALKRQLDGALANTDSETSQANKEAVILERKIVADLREQLSTIQLEKQSLVEQSKTEARSVQDALRREQDRSRATEDSLRNEISLMENKLEMFRARTEEVSSGTTGDAHAKLIRQIENLQTQYAVASENWHGIEGSMQSRMADLEKEKDECQRLEVETRKKAREANSRSRKLQDDLDDATRVCRRLERETGEQEATIQMLQSRLSDLEKESKNEIENFRKDRRTWEMATQARIDEEKVRLRQELESQAISRTTSPPATRKPSGLEIPSYPARRIANRNTSMEPVFPPADVLDRSMTRRRSNLFSRISEVSSPGGFESERTTPQFNNDSRSRTPSVPRNAPETPSVQTADREDPLENRASPQRTVNDMISGSTLNAGPSVQLVERMSAAVRRLESEKAASKEEIGRLSSQRDEARKEIVSLMREVEEKRDSDKKTTKLEAELADITRRYQTTLEMLGEKSEQVEELRADVYDLKKIYKDLVERSLK